MNIYETMSNEELKKYIPDVYQKTIFGIDYSQLQNAGIKVISFDVDDTIIQLEKPATFLSADVILKFQELRNMGFEMYLISNNISEHRVRKIGEKLGADYIPDAGKPDTRNFDMIRQQYFQKHGTPIQPKEMAHIGNSMRKDVAFGNTYGVTTCLVRRLGEIGGIIHHHKRHELRKVLKDRHIWRKHHKYVHGDQYYQLYDTPLSQAW